MKSKLFKLLISGIVATSCLAAPLYATTPVATAAATTSTTDQLGSLNVKFDGFTRLTPIAYIHDGNNRFNDSYSVNAYTAKLLVRNCTYDKTIVIHAQNASGEWVDSDPATYVETLADGTEVWTVSGYFDGNAEFCVWYKEADSWDNNNTNNYFCYNYPFVY